MLIAETERLILRTFTVNDAEDLYRIYGEPENMEFMGQALDSIESERENIRKHQQNYYENYGFGLWATVLKENNQLIGRCGFLYQEIEGVRAPEIAYLIDHRYWGRGLATEAAGKILNLGFEKYNFKRVTAVINQQNIASIHVAEKIGLNYEREIAYKSFGEVSLYAINQLT